MLYWLLRITDEDGDLSAVAYFSLLLKEAFNIKKCNPIQTVPFSDNLILICYKDAVICY
jgi:hypothetical protein